MSRGSTPISGSPEEVAELRVVAKAPPQMLEQKAELEAAYARIKELMAEAEKEEVRWQERIAAVITSAGLTPIDASGNESGDPLDWTADQVGAALGEAMAADAHVQAVSELRAQLASADARAASSIEERDFARATISEVVRVACAASNDAERALRKAGLLDGAAGMGAAAIASAAKADAFAEAAAHVERHSCVSTCCDANPSANEAKALAECIRAHGRRT